MRRTPHALSLRLVALLLALPGCGSCQQAAPGVPCTFVDEGYGPEGKVRVSAETVVSGLEVPWSVLFLPGGDLLVSERPGRIRLVSAGKLVEQPVATMPVAEVSEGGLLGLALDPKFPETRRFFLYVTAPADGRAVNRVERWLLSEDHQTASREAVILDGIPAAPYHDGGRIRFGPDGMLYVCTGDARKPELAQQAGSPNGKLLRITPEGKVPADNPLPGNPAFILGLRNPEGLDWYDEKTLAIADHGPSGELLRSGHDEVNLARAGDNLGWPAIYGCRSRSGLLPPRLSWKGAVPPGGAAFYRGEAIPEWQGSLLVGTLRSRHLHRVVFDEARPHKVRSHEVYFEGDPPKGLGRLREVVMGPDGQLYVTTSNCDGRGTCPPEKDKLLRIVPAK